MTTKSGYDLAGAFESIKSDDFEYVCRMARSSAGLVFEAGKEYLVESRLGKLAKERGFARMSDLIGALRTEIRGGPLREAVVESLTTNETYFFRDFHPFESLAENFIPDLLRRRQGSGRLTIWSAACSTGQEPYSLAMLLRERFPALAEWNVTIVASDICGSALEQARQGSYTQFEVNRGLPAALLVRYFSKQGDRWVIDSTIRDMVQFRRLNLNEPWGLTECFDIVLARNVMIYFDTPTKREILGKLRRVLRPDGALLLGGSESTVSIDESWKATSYGKSVFYRY